MAEVITGLERFVSEGPAAAGLESGARLALLSHPASIDRRGRHAIELLSSLPGCSLALLFAPEHGLWGHEQDMERVRGATEPSTGLRVISLYGSTAASLTPQPGDLEGLDAVVIDLQDVGSRYYTYIYTMSYVMEAARRAALPVAVLDRPNPIGGEMVEGPLLDRSLSSFVGRYPLPVRHGMTVAELATLFNDAFGIGCDLRVVEMKGWNRAMQFEQTALPWVPPSPNMPSPATARVYPGGCLVEGTNLSEGRGTTMPFELVGAPWIDGDRLAEAMRSAGLSGVIFRPASFRPMFQKHAGHSCGGLQVIVTDHRLFRPFSTYVALLRVARLQGAESFQWRGEPYEFEEQRPAIDLLLGRKDLRPLIESGAPLVEIEKLWESDADQFEPLRSGFLRYG
jgi:uncharacterized protein YbbC (DUF1343 family)